MRRSSWCHGALLAMLLLAVAACGNADTSSSDALDTSGGDTSVPSGCGEIPDHACCEHNTVKVCRDGQVFSQACIDSPSCGWKETVAYAGYDCGTDGGADPQGLYPQYCPGCVPDCDGTHCGSDGCGGMCQTCATGLICDEATSACVAPCGDVTQQGCCANDVAKWCDNGKLRFTICSDTPACGWSTAGNQYECGTDGGADPAGEHPKVCPGCVADCTGRACGDNGCGESCGTCGAGQACQGGQCAPCTADCEGKTCGDDGCGGSCGTCGAIEICAWKCISMQGFRVELTWDTPSDSDQTDTGPMLGADLDLHLANSKASQPDLDGDGIRDPWFDPTWDSFWFYSEQNWGSTSSADDNPVMIRDDVDGIGPEIIAIGLLEADKTYPIGVNYWDDHGFGPSWATVKVYRQDVLVFSVTDVMLVDHNFWWVCTLDGATGVVSAKSKPDGTHWITEDYHNSTFYQP